MFADEKSKLPPLICCWLVLARLLSPLSLSLSVVVDVVASQSRSLCVVGCMVIVAARVGLAVRLVLLTKSVRGAAAAHLGKIQQHSLPGSRMIETKNAQFQQFDSYSLANVHSSEMNERDTHAHTHTHTHTKPLEKVRPAKLKP